MSRTLPRFVNSSLQTASRLGSEMGTRAERGGWAELSRQSQSSVRPNWLQFPGKNIREEGPSQRERSKCLQRGPTSVWMRTDVCAYARNCLRPGKNHQREADRKTNGAHAGLGTVCAPSAREERAHNTRGTG